MDITGISKTTFGPPYLSLAALAFASAFAVSASTARSVVAINPFFGQPL